MSRLRRIPLLALAPVLALLALTAWVFASPIGAGPDDDYHLVSSWCAGPTAEETCAPGEQPSTRVVPVALNDIECFAYDPLASASCQGEVWSWSVNEVVETDRGNFLGAYPPVYYAVMGALTGPDIQAAALGMRVLTVVLFLAITTALFLLLPLRLRAPLIWGWLITTVPLGVFLLGTNNPSAWAMIGVGSSWLALLGWFDATGRRKAGLGALFVVGVLMAAGSRGDAALYAGLGIVLVLLLTVARRRGFWLDAILPVVMGLVALAFFLSARQSQSGLAGFSGSSEVPAVGVVTEPEQALSGFGIFAYNLLNVPFLWSGVLGDWALGWLDTSIPPLVSAATTAAFVAIGFVGLGRMWGRKALVLGLLVVTLVALPVYVLQAGGDLIGEQVQPRYLLPLIVLLGGMLMLARSARPITFTLVQRFVIVASLSGANFVALHFNMRRYITGIDGASVDLDTGAEWWWAGPIGPNAVWLLGSVAYALLVWILVRSIARPSIARPSIDEGAPVDSSAPRDQAPGMPITR
ncbi:MAG: DUF2142 domain-containing protein [Microcella pacifica]|uniref:DUF2142 domain-containing protein n=1 Tax=Microcella pacifica TaxID=2591847 RepID=UPI0033156315